MNPPSSAPLVWVDLEMTGLDPARHVIIEVASIVTDAHLNVIAEGPVLAVRRTDEELARIDEWSLRTHKASGLLARVRESAVDIAEAERRTLDFVREYVGEKASPLCGNSVHQDRLFIAREMPAFDAYLHYRIVDVSSVKELVRRWYPFSLQAPNKKGSHLALDDIRESIEELRWYRQRVFAAPPLDGPGR
jgi:oligoribonuclease